MIIDCPNAQFISSNIMDIAEVIIRFKELDACYSNNLCLYLDSDIWEVFDQRRGITIIRHDFKHVHQLIQDMKRFINDFANVNMLNLGLSKRRTIKTHEAVSIKHLFKVYGFDTYLFKNNNLRNYIYGKFKEKENQRDNY